VDEAWLVGLFRTYLMGSWVSWVDCLSLDRDVSMGWDGQSMCRARARSSVSRGRYGTDSQQIEHPAVVYCVA
jgi:hypothetical protein